MTTAHPIQSDLRVEMNVGFVLVDSNLIDRKFCNHPTNPGQTSALLPTREGTQYNGLGVAAACTQTPEYATHHADTDSDACPLLGHTCQQLPRPGRSLVLEVQGGAREHVVDKAHELGGSLRGPDREHADGGALTAF